MKKIKVLLATIALLCATSCNANNDNIDSLFYHVYEEGFMPLDFESIYYIDTTNMVIYYDNYDQFDMDLEYEEHPENINEDSNLMLHISRSTMIELFNRILQWIDMNDEPTNDALYIQAMFGISQNEKGEYWIVYLGN